MTADLNSANAIGELKQIMNPNNSIKGKQAKLKLVIYSVDAPIKSLYGALTLAKKEQISL